jgi:NitT/TauT family transport system permease protein
MAVEERDFSRELAGLDALEGALDSRPSLARRIWAQVWPKLAAIAIALFVWQLVVWSHWRPSYVLPGPGKTLPELWDLLGTGDFWKAVQQTLQRAIWGYVLAVVIGTVVGVAVARVQVLRTAVGSMITGIQTMPSVAWFPLAILLFQLSEKAILFVVVLGAAPSIANGVIAGVDHVPPILLRSGRMLGAKGWKTYRHVVMPAALPTFVSGLKQGWAFAWRSLMAGELIANIPGKTGIGTKMDFARTLNNTELLISYMIVLLVLGILIDSLFGKADATLRKRWGLIDPATG